MAYRKECPVAMVPIGSQRTKKARRAPVRCKGRSPMKGSILIWLFAETKDQIWDMAL